MCTGVCSSSRGCHSRLCRRASINFCLITRRTTLNTATGRASSSKLDMPINEYSLNRSSPMDAYTIESLCIVHSSIAFIAKCHRFRLTEHGSRRFIAVFTERQGGDGGGKRDSLMRYRLWRMLMEITDGTDDVAMGNTEDLCCCGRAAIAHGTHAY